MNYNVIKEAYKDNPELQLMDALDLLSRDPVSASEILKSVASQTNNEKIDVELPQTGPTETVFSQESVSLFDVISG